MSFSFKNNNKEVVRVVADPHPCQTVDHEALRDVARRNGIKYSPDTEARDAAGQALGNLARVLTPNSRRIIEQDTVQLDRAGRAGGRRRQSPLARAANATSVVWTSPLAGES